jgi:hypothetical protein
MDRAGQQLLPVPEGPLMKAGASVVATSFASRSTLSIAGLRVMIGAHAKRHTLLNPHRATDCVPSKA